MRVLVAEDNSSIRWVMTDMLEHLGHEVVTVCDGEEAREHLLRGEVFDAIITDNNMPRLNGEDLLRWFRAEFEPNSQTKLIISSGNVTTQIEELCRATGIVSMPKPVNLEDLQACL